jgi:hypothetical protein
VSRIGVAALLALAGCHGGAKQQPAAPDMSFVPAFAAHDKVDILFMIDSSGTAPIQAELHNRFPQLVKALQNFAAAGHPASYHIGVVDEDLGAGPYVLNQGQCHPDGDRGTLRVAPAAGTPNVPAACQSFSLGGGVRFIDYDQINGTDNIMGLTPGDVATAFACIGAVGDAGCGFEHQLESVYRALHDPPVENTGFLRDDALLAVLFLTDEDDCSAPPDSDLFDPSPEGVAKYGPLHSFRCTEFGIQCNGMPVPPMSISGLTGCSSQEMANGGKLFDVQRYIDFFARPGGVKADPSDVILASIAAPPAPVGVLVTMPCADQVNTPQCPILNHSCVDASNAIFFGDPAVRISAVVDAAVTSQRTSLCDADYSSAIDALAQSISARLR